mmetsp:Transcript_88081/g.139162  ORF Transcript_88081/g.139162 Transcript_88081/m.139162 type:complete len:202 (-) Transcript_88081:206-811(-)
MADTSKASAERAVKAGGKRTKKRGAIMLQYYLAGTFAVGICVLAALLAMFGSAENDSDDETVSSQHKDTVGDDYVTHEIHHIMSGFDTNGDNMISMEELMEREKIELEGNPEKRHWLDGWTDGFREADFDKDGKLTVEEVRMLLNTAAMSSLADRFARSQSDPEYGEELDPDADGAEGEEHYSDSLYHSEYPEALEEEQAD